jgi:hypothetical protein
MYGKACSVVTTSDTQTQMMCSNIVGMILRLVAWLLSFAVDAEVRLLSFAVDIIYSQRPRCWLCCLSYDAPINWSMGSRSKLAFKRLRAHCQQQRRSSADSIALQVSHRLWLLVQSCTDDG